MNKVVAAKAERDDIEKCVYEALDLADLSMPNDGANIIIKPNLCTARRSPDEGATTDASVVEAVVQYIRSKRSSCDIAIVESNGERGSKADIAFKRFGYLDLSRKLDLDLVNLDNQPTKEVGIPHVKKPKHLQVPEILLSMNYYISVAKLKRHTLERFTGVWKNQYGLIPNRRLREKLHPFLSEVLFDLNHLFPPDLSIIDGITGLEGSGPIDGKPKRMDLIICSQNPVSADIVAASIIGENPRNIPHLRYALTHGLEDAENLIILREPNISEQNFQFISEWQYLRGRLQLYRQRILSILGLYQLD